MRAGNRQARPAPQPADPVSDVVAQALGPDAKPKREALVVMEAVLAPGDVLLLPVNAAACRRPFSLGCVFTAAAVVCRRRTGCTT